MIDSEQLIKRHNSKINEEKSSQLFAFFSYAGFNSDGITYVPTNTDDETIAKLRANYCPYYKVIGYHSPVKIKDVEMRPIHWQAVVVFDEKWGRYKFDFLKCRDELSRIYRDHLTSDEIGAGFRGTVGKKYASTVKFTGSVVLPIKSDFGDLHILYFADEEGYRFAWMQRNFSKETLDDFIKGNCKDGVITLIGTVKKHETIKARKYTVMTRCEIIGQNGLSISGYAKNKRESIEKSKTAK